MHGWPGAVTGAELWRREVKSDPIPARREVNERFEVGVAHWPVRWGKSLAVLVMLDCQIAIQRLLLRISNFTVN